VIRDRAWADWRQRVVTAPYCPSCPLTTFVPPRSSRSLALASLEHTFYTEFMRRLSQRRAGAPAGVLAARRAIPAERLFSSVWRTLRRRAHSSSFRCLLAGRAAHALPSVSGTPYSGPSRPLRFGIARGCHVASLFPGPQTPCRYATAASCPSNRRGMPQGHAPVASRRASQTWARSHVLVSESAANCGMPGRLLRLSRPVPPCPPCRNRMFCPYTKRSRA
jgi:hypothetical protein